MYQVLEQLMNSYREQFAARLRNPGNGKSAVIKGTNNFPVITETTLVAEEYLNPSQGFVQVNFKANSKNKGNQAHEVLLGETEWFQPLYAAIYIGKYWTNTTTTTLDIYPFINQGVFTDAAEQLSLLTIFHGARIEFSIGKNPVLEEIDARLFMTVPPVANHAVAHEINPYIEDHGFKRFAVNQIFNGVEDSILRLTLGTGDTAAIDGDGIVLNQKNKVVIKLFGLKYTQMSGVTTGACPVNNSL